MKPLSFFYLFIAMILMVSITAPAQASLNAPATWHAGYKLYGQYWDLMGEVGIKNGSVNVTNMVANNTPWIDIRAWGAAANGSSNDTAELKAVLDAQTADTTGNQTVVMIPGFGWWNQTSLNPATAVKNGTCVLDLSGNSTKMGGIFTYCDSYNTAGAKDSEYTFASGYHPAFATVNYGAPSVNNVIGSYVNYFWNYSSDSVQTTTQFSSEVDSDSEYGETLYTYTDGAGKTLAARNLQRWYYDGGTIVRGGQYGILLKDLSNNNVLEILPTGNISVSPVKKPSCITMRSPDGTAYRLTVANGGAVGTAAGTCDT